MAEKQQVELTQLDVRDLGLIKEQIEGEVQSLTQSAVALQKAAAEFGKSGRSIEQLASREEGCSTLVPLTGSLYVKGTLAGADKVLLDVGTGYYVERSTAEGVDYCKRKVNFLRDNISEVVEVLKEKQGQLHQVDAVLRQKVAATS